MKKSKKYKIVITGPESTGKTDLAENLAKHYKVSWIPEYARGYVEKLNRKYTFEDVENIAKKQIEIYHESLGNNNYMIFIDTYLIIIKVWFEYVYKKIPVWLNEEIKNSQIDLFLVCNTDIPWIFDPIRENGGEMRELLLKEYIDELEFYGFNYEIVSGVGNDRINNAIEIIENLFKSN